MSLLRAERLFKRYPRPGGGWQTALAGVDLDLEPGQVVGLVGESGCGKSTLARCLVWLERPDSGELLLDGRSLAAGGRAVERELRRTVQMVFQDPVTSLDPRMTVERIVAEPFRDRRRRRHRVTELLQRVGLDPDLLTRFPHQLSGGQRQRVGIARALAPGPRLLIADEPLSALDTLVKARVMQLLLDLTRQQLGLLLITHDLRLALAHTQRVVVMYLGRVVERGPASLLRTAPVHPYTRALGAAMLSLDPAAPLPEPALFGDVPRLSSDPTGCPFHPRCPLYAKTLDPRCRQTEPSPSEPSADHFVACHQIKSNNSD